jgi:conjugal transfer/entry exclusion protein
MMVAMWEKKTAAEKSRIRAEAERFLKAQS